MKRWLVLLCLSFGGLLLAQESGPVDTAYLEDQFYFGLTYNALLEKPDAINQQNLSYGIQTGFIKDIPLNTNRTFALGLGIGYATNSYYSNLLVSQVESDILYGDNLEDIENVKRNKLETHTVEFPIEFRWRNSTPTEFKFWRFYPGIKLGYVFSGRSKLVTDSDKTSFNNDDLRSFQYGAMINFGYNTFNLHLYYGFNSLFNDDVSLGDGNTLSMKPLRLGIIFYIL
ncbi:MAG: PorT family protein [Eudoraea sp.]|nr:PorT family protein [Eudoraea sp.]